MLRMLKGEKGFTLIELMVVVLIIAILIAIAIPVYNAYQDNAKKAACQSNLRIYNGATQNWKAAHGNYPGALSDLWTGTDKVVKKEYFCPGGGTYTLGADGDVTCSLAATKGHEI